jgi:hypothetical protein
MGVLAQLSISARSPRDLRAGTDAPDFGHQPELGHQLGHQTQKRAALDDRPA